MRSPLTSKCGRISRTKTKRFITTAHRLAGGLGMPTDGQPLDPAAGLPALAAAEEELSIKWEQVLMLGSPEALLRGRPGRPRRHQQRDPPMTWPPDWQRPPARALRAAPGTRPDTAQDPTGTLAAQVSDGHIGDRHH
jgi:hypothetical protein